ncbi:MAG: hypothetical protein ACK4RF_11025 [Cyclobacteriaceae bacterium]
MNRVTKLLALLAGLSLLISVSACVYDQVVPQQPDVGTVSFSNDIIPIFNSSCNVTGCHNGTQVPDLRPANAYNSLTAGGYVNTGNPEASELYQWMSGNRGLPMPPGGSNNTYNAYVLAWIQQGALDN